MQNDEGHSATWVKECNAKAVDLKKAMARFCANHLVEYGNRLQVGSGTTFNYLMDQLLERQQGDRPLDLVLLTTNLTVMQKGRDARLDQGGLFNSMQIILTGGALQPSLHSLVGTFAAQGVSTGVIIPDIVFVGAAGLSFAGGAVHVTYQFEEELSTQVAYATRRTNHRILLCDHTKLGKDQGWRANITMGSMLKEAEICTFITSLPDDDDGPAQESVDREAKAFEELLKNAAGSREFHDKDIRLWFINKDGENKRSLQLSDVRKKEDHA